MGRARGWGPPVPLCSPALAETIKSPGHPDRALATDQATHERETNTAILPNKALCCYRLRVARILRLRSVEPRRLADRDRLGISGPANRPDPVRRPSDQTAIE